MPWRIDGHNAIYTGSDETWSASVDRTSGGCRLLGRDRELVAAFASGDAYPNSGLAIRVDGAWQPLGATDEAVVNDDALTLSWSKAKASARIDTGPEVGVRWRVSAPEAEAVALSLVAEADEHFYGMGER